MIYINRKLFSRTFTAHYKNLTLLNGHFIIKKRRSSECRVLIPDSSIVEKNEEFLIEISDFDYEICIIEIRFTLSHIFLYYFITRLPLQRNSKPTLIFRKTNRHFHLLQIRSIFFSQSKQSKNLSMFCFYLPKNEVGNLVSPSI